MRQTTPAVTAAAIVPPRLPPPASRKPAVNAGDAGGNAEGTAGGGRGDGAAHTSWGWLVSNASCMQKVGMQAARGYISRTFPLERLVLVPRAPEGELLHASFIGELAVRLRKQNCPSPKLVGGSSNLRMQLYISSAHASEQKGRSSHSGNTGIGGARGRNRPVLGRCGNKGGQSGAGGEDGADGGRSGGAATLGGNGGCDGGAEGPRHVGCGLSGPGLAYARMQGVS